MSLLSIDLYVFIFWSFVCYKINSKSSIAIYLVKSCTSYLPPEDSDMKLIVPEETKDKKGKKGEKDEKKQEDMGSFELKQFQLDNQVAEYVKEFLLEYDFVVILSLITTLAFISTSIVKFFIDAEVTSSFCYYLMLCCLVFCVYYMIKHNLFPFDFGDENKILLLFALKTFIISYMLTGYFTQYVDFELSGGLQKLQIQLNKLTKITDGKIIVSPDFFFIVLSIMASFMSITVVHLAIKYSYHFFFINKSIELSTSQGDHENIEKLGKRRMMLAINFFSPILVLFLYIPALSKSILVPSLLSNEGFQVFRIIVLAVIILFKASCFLTELQFDFNENYLYIQKLYHNRTEKLFKYIQLKMKLKLINSWVTCFQYLAISLIPFMLLLAYAHRLIVFLNSPQLPEYDFTELEKSVPESTFTDSREISMTDGAYLSHALKQVLVRGLVPLELEMGIIGYFMFTYYMSWFIVSSLGLVYYRKFKAQ